MGSLPRSGRSPGEGHGNPLQYSCLENPMDRGARLTLQYRRMVCMLPFFRLHCILNIESILTLLKLKSPSTEPSSGFLTHSDEKTQSVGDLQGLLNPLPVALFPILLWPHWPPPYYGLKVPAVLSPQGLCIGCFLCPKCSSLDSCMHFLYLLYILT